MESNFSIFSKAAIAFLIIVFFSASTRAEDGCPPGQIPHAGNDINSCGPVPPGYYGNQQQRQSALPPQHRWVTQWGAVATHESDGSLGTVINMVSESSARQAALADCQSKHGSTCKVDLAYHDQCAAMIVSLNGYNVGGAATSDEAVRIGMKICKDAGAANCHPGYIACSLPLQVQ